MSPSPQPPHGQANSVSATVGRAIGPVLVLLVVTVALALLSAPAAGKIVIVSSSAGQSDLPAAADTAGEPTTGSGLTAVVGPTSANANGDGTTAPLIMEERTAGSGFATDGDGLQDGLMVATHGDVGGTGANTMADGAWDFEGTHLTAPPHDSTVALDGPAGQPDPLVPGSAGDHVAFGADAGSSDSHAMSGGASGNLQGEGFKRPWGLTPSAPVSPATIGGIAFGFLLGAGAFAVARPEGVRNWQPTPGTDNEIPGSDPVDPSLADGDHVPDEAIVEGILLSQDGRMKQSAIVNMTDWSKAKVSRVLSAMADEGSVVKVRIGRENLVCLDGWEPDALKHPHAA